MAEQADGLTAGVNYGVMDPTKVAAQDAGRSTSHYLERFGFREVAESRGESVFLIEGEDHYLAFLLEGLGTKNLVADVMWHFLGPEVYASCGQDGMAMIVNDLITLGALPMVSAQYFAAGSDRVFANPARMAAVREGWTNANHLGHSTYGPGETPTLRDVIFPTTFDLAGGALGIIKPKSCRINPADIRPSDKIIMVAASGVHANGYTGLRDLADIIGYMTKMADGRTFGEALLDPTPIYVSALEAIFDAGILPHYAINITGHGWRKLMRATQQYTYRITAEWEINEIFRFIMEQTGMGYSQMLAAYNMGAGFAFIVGPNFVETTLTAIHKAGFEAWEAGVVEEGPKQVIIEPYGVTFTAESMNLR